MGMNDVEEIKQEREKGQERKEGWGGREKTREKVSCRCSVALYYQLCK